VTLDVRPAASTFHSSSLVTTAASRGTERVLVSEERSLTSVGRRGHVRRRVARGGGLACLVAAGLVLAACSSSSKSTTATTAAGGSSASSGGSSASTGAATGTTYTIGTIAGVTGPYAASVGGAFKLDTAWEKWTNAHGGVNGHPVDIIQKDDTGVPATGISVAKDLFANNDVIAIVGPTSNTENAWQSLITPAGIAVIGGQINSIANESIPNVFPTGTTQSGYGKAILNALSVVGGKQNVAVLYCTEAPACKVQADSISTAATQFAADVNNAKVVYKAAIAGSAPNYTANCLAAKQAGADAMFTSDGASVNLRVYNDCAAQGLKVQIAASSGSFDPTWLTASSTAGTQLVQTDFPHFAKDLPSQQAFQSAIQQYAPDLVGSNLLNGGLSADWAALEVWKAAMEKAKTGDHPTRADVLKAMRALPAGFTIDGITPPLTYDTAGGVNPPIYCYFGGTINNGAYATTNGGKSICPKGN
jgi:branched-chain amino acid transport system substrate-binding protein